MSKKKKKKDKTTVKNVSWVWSTKIKVCYSTSNHFILSFYQIPFWVEISVDMNTTVCG